MAEFPKLIEIRVDNNNWNAQRTEVVCGLRVNNCAQCNGMDDGVAQGLEDLLQRPVAPVAMLSNIEGVLVDSAFTVKHDKYEINLTSLKKGCKRRDCKQKDGWGVCLKSNCCDLQTSDFLSGGKRGRQEGVTISASVFKIK